MAMLALFYGSVFAFPVALAGLTGVGVLLNIFDKRSEDSVDAIYFFPPHTNNLTRADMHVMRHMVAEPKENATQPGEIVFRNGDLVAEGTMVADNFNRETLWDNIYTGNVTLSLPDHSAPIEGYWIVVDPSVKNDTEIVTSFRDLRSSLIDLMKLEEHVDIRSKAFLNLAGALEKAGE